MNGYPVQGVLDGLRNATLYLQVDQFLTRLEAAPSMKAGIYENNDLYYLAGHYDPVLGAIQFNKGVLTGS